MLMCMCMLNKRTHILLEQDLWFQLMTLAKAQDVSIGELVRKAVKEVYFGENKKEKMAKAMETILETRKKLKRFKRIDYKELINYGRKY